MAKMTLFAVPYAGGSASAVFNRWKPELGEDIDLHPLEYAGHGVRMAEDFFESIEATVADMMHKIRPIARVQPYAIYGHSMGCVVVYELLKAIASENLPAADMVFLSGRNPPHKHYDTNIHKLPDDEFLNEIRKIGGTSSDFFEMKELVRTFLPILRNDYKIIEQYQMELPLWETTAGITFFYSDQNGMVNLSSVSEWGKYTCGAFSLYK